LLDGIPAATKEVRKRRITLKQIAERAGLSVATVDRVINGRRPVRRATAMRVQSAADALGYKSAVSIDVDSGLETITCAVLLQKKTTFIYQNLAEELMQVSHSVTGRRIALTVEFVENYLDPANVAERMHSLGEQTEILVVVATESPYISEAIAVLAGRRIPVVALLSDLSAPDLGGYVGINDRIAGRTAAWAIARCASQPGSVGILIGSHGYLGQEDREIGFRTYFREKAPNFKILEPAVCNDDLEIAYEQTLEMLHSSEKLVGLYSVGGGTRGTIRAIEESQLLTKPAYVCHPLTPATRGGLIRGTVDVVIAPDIPELARATVQMCLKLREAANLTKQAAIVPFIIYTSENVVESSGLRTMFLGHKKEL
jgi:LacI family transcriptional regulator, galactose operon repressor